jgi:serine/threonine protein kinase/WD40 repeat protein/tetratricopeptide (TPR) repeat protein
MSESTSDRNPFELLAAEFADRLRRGEHPSINEYVDRYPELADDIRELFPALALVEQFKPGPREVEVPVTATAPPACDDMPTQLGDYRIVRYLGEGGMGVVYEAVRESLRCHVALKVMHGQFRNRPSYLQRFHREARSAAGLHHTNIVSVFDYGDHDGICYYAMQFIAGQSLDKVLDDIRQLRREKEGVPAGATLPLTRSENGQAAIEGMGGDDGEQRAARSLGQTVTLMLLTGQFARPGIRDGPGGQDPRPSIELDLGPVEQPENFGTATRRFVSELRHAQAGVGSPQVPNSASGTHRDSGSLSFVDSSSALTGKTDVRYYREVARLGAQVADALAYAHQRGVLHRDIKPPNLILDALGNVWITDFGLAKFEEGEDLSQSQDLVGTLRYMPPERFRGVSDRQGDVYALGATLYELLTLHPAFQGKDQLELIHRIENDPPVPLRQIDRRIPADLETIVLKTLAKEPADRFASAEELAAELRRFVENRPIRSRPIPYHQQFWRWCKRNPKLAAANITAAALTTILAVVSTVAAFIYHDRNERTIRDNVRIQRAENDTREQLVAALTAQARAGRYSRQMGQRFDGLAAISKAAKIASELKLAPEQLDPLRDQAIACLAVPDLRPVDRIITRPAGAIAFTFDAKLARYALRFRDGTVQVRRVADDQEIARFQARGDREIAIHDFSPDGRYLATSHQPGASLTVWDIEKQVACVSDPGPVNGHSISFSRDSRTFALVKDYRDLLIFDLAAGQPIRRWAQSKLGEPAFRPDGAQIAVNGWASVPPACWIFESATGRLVQTIALPTAPTGIAWSPDGATLATACVDAKIYVWDATTGTRRAFLEGSSHGGMRAAFHPTGALVASNGDEGRLRLWDAALGRPILSVGDFAYPEFSLDGRIVVAAEHQLTTYEVDAALEYRSFAHEASPPLNFARPSIHRGGRLLALGTNRGVVLWDLARGTELTFMPIGLAWHTTFAPSGDLLTSGSLGVWRWPIRLRSDGGLYRIGPPHEIPLPASGSRIDVDRSGQIIALANRSDAHVVTPDRRFHFDRLDDCRYVAVSPNGEWLATGTHVASRGAQVWRIRDTTKVADLPIDYGTGVIFSPDSRWLMTTMPPCRLWEVGTWREATQKIGGQGCCFSPDGSQVIVQDANKTIRLVETETGRTLARLESPDQCAVALATFAPDGSRLIFSTNDGPAVHVWDLRATRRNLAKMGLDWDAPPFTDEDPASPSAPALPPLQVDYGQLRPVVEQYNTHAEQTAVPAEDLVARYTERLKVHPDDPDALHHRGHAQLDLGRYDQALADFSAALGLRPSDAHLRVYRGVCLFDLKRYGPAMDQLESAFQTHPDSIRAVLNIDQALNDAAWLLATGPEPGRDPAIAARMATLSVALAPDQHTFLNTLGVALYRAGKFAQAIATLEKSVATGHGGPDAFDLFFLAMAHHRLGHRVEARGAYDRAVLWLRDQKSLSDDQRQELAGFRAEAEAVLARPTNDLPAGVFAPD